MVAKSLGELETHAFFVVLVAVVLIAMWFSVWGLLEESAAWLEKEKGVQRRSIYLILFAATMAFVAVVPSAFERIF